MTLFVSVFKASLDKDITLINKINKYIYSSDFHATMQRLARMKRELQMLKTNSLSGIACWPTSLEHLEAQIVGRVGSPYEGGVFKLKIDVPERYPFEPPQVTFVTPIYHPNIDSAGRICLNILKLPPSGGWKPCLNISTILTSIQVLMAEPNPDDPLMADIANEFKYDNEEFKQKARLWTQKHAMKNNCEKPSNSTNESSSEEAVLPEKAESVELGKRSLPLTDANKQVSKVAKTNKLS